MIGKCATENLLLTKLLTQVAFHFAKRQYDDTLV